jgi:hypothetical protein
VNSIAEKIKAVTNRYHALIFVGVLTSPKGDGDPNFVSIGDPLFDLIHFGDQIVFVDGVTKVDFLLFRFVCFATFLGLLVLLVFVFSVIQGLSRREAVGWERSPRDRGRRLEPASRLHETQLPVLEISVNHEDSTSTDLLIATKRGVMLFRSHRTPTSLRSSVVENLTPFRGLNPVSATAVFRLKSVSFVPHKMRSRRSSFAASRAFARDRTAWNPFITVELTHRCPSLDLLAFDDVLSSRPPFHLAQNPCSFQVICEQNSALDIRSWRVHDFH